MRFYSLDRNCVLLADLRIDSHTDKKYSLKQLGESLTSPDTDLLRDLCVISLIVRH